MLKRIKQYLDYKGISISAFEKSIGMSNASFGKSLKSGGTIGSDKLENILRAYSEINPEWLVTGKGDMLKSYTMQDPSPLIVREETVEYRKVRPGIPLVPIDARAGFAAGDDLSILYSDCERYDIPEFKGIADFMIKVSGDSMQPRYLNGDTLACKRITADWIQWNRAYVLDTDQGPLVKRVRKGTSDETLTLESDNKAYEAFEIPRSSVRSMALIIGFIRLQ